jgi:TetR/AcrR family transcriptional repressor of uid operon
MVSRTAPTSVESSLIGYGDGGRQSPLPAPPTQARGVDKRDRLYEAAIARYDHAGVANTRVEDVIADAGVSWATFFRYFPRKEDVLIEGAARHFRNHVRAVAERGLRDRRLRVRTVIERTFTALLEPAELPPALHNAAMLEVFASPPRFAALVGDHPQPVIGLVAELLGEGRNRGEVRPEVEPSLAAMVLTAGCMLPAAQAAAAGADPLQGARMALEVLWGGLANRDGGRA